MTLLFAVLLQLFLLMPLSAEIPSANFQPAYEMTVIPRDVFIGDEMEIRYVFHSDRNLLSEDAEQIDIDVPDSEDITVADMKLSKEADSFVITAHCTAWRTGAVKLPEIVLPQEEQSSEEPEETEEPQKKEAPVVIQIPPLTIQSVVEYTGKNELRPVRAPLVIPGTTWIIYVLIILCVLLFVALVIILLRFKAFKSHFFGLFSSVLIARNYRLLRRRIRRLLKRYLKAETEEFATELAHFIRGYMSVRFKLDFNSVTASEFVSVFAEAMNYTGSPESFGATEVIADILLRCDYVRFSGDTGERGSLSGEERSTMCSEFLTAVACYDREATV